MILKGSVFQNKTWFLRFVVVNAIARAYSRIVLNERNEIERKTEPMRFFFLGWKGSVFQLNLY